MRIADEAADGRLGRGRGAALPGDRHTGRRADEKREGVIGTKRIGFGGRILQQVIQPHRAAAPIGAIKIFGRRLDGECSVSQIDVQHFSRKTIHTEFLLGRIVAQSTQASRVG